MKQRQQNSLNMHQAVIAFFNEKPEIWNVKAPVTQAFSNFKQFSDRFSKASYAQQAEVTNGYTVQKEEHKASLVAGAYALSLKLKGFAKMNHDAVLAQAVDYSLSDLDRCREQDLMNRCQAIHDKGAEYLDRLTDYGVTPEVLAELQTAIENFKPMGAQRDGVGDKRVLATVEMEATMKKASEALSLLDDLVEGLITDTEFLKGYRQARKITDRRGRKVAEEVVEDSGS